MDAYRRGRKYFQRHSQRWVSPNWAASAKFKIPHQIKSHGAKLECLQIKLPKKPSGCFDATFQVEVSIIKIDLLSHMQDYLFHHFRKMDSFGEMPTCLISSQVTFITQLKFTCVTAVKSCKRKLCRYREVHLLKIVK